MRDSDSPLLPGDLFRMEGRVWRVEYVNLSRAYCFPVTRGPEGGANISPHALVERVTEASLDDSELERLAARYIEEADEAEGGSVAKQAKKSKVKGKVAPAPVRKAEAKEKKSSKCLCGCGETTGKNFYPGHDSKFKGWLIALERGKVTREDLPAQARRAFENLNFKFVKKGDGIIPTTNYKGEPHGGYVKESPSKRSARVGKSSGPSSRAAELPV